MKPSRFVTVQHLDKAPVIQVGKVNRTPFPTELLYLYVSDE